jgi:hypothetical protein
MGTWMGGQMPHNGALIHEAVVGLIAGRKSLPLGFHDTSGPLISYPSDSDFMHQDFHVYPQGTPCRKACPANRHGKHEYHQNFQWNCILPSCLQPLTRPAAAAVVRPTTRQPRGSARARAVETSTRHRPVRSILIFYRYLTMLI